MPMDSDFDLAALRAFRAVVREGSFTAAAAALRAPKSTVSKRVADLESSLGVRLIERTTRNLRVTAEGEVLAQRAERLLGEAEDIRRELGEAGSAPRGHLRIAVPSSVGQMLMGELSAKFRRQHPEITLEMPFLDRAPDMLEEGFDGALRFGPLEDSGLVARQIARLRSVVTAAPDLPGIDAVQHPRDLAHLPMIGPSPCWSTPWTLYDAEGTAVEVPYAPELMLGSFLAIRDAVIAGAGVAPMPSFLAQQEIAAGRMVHLLPDWTGHVKTLLFVYSSPQSVTARLRAFIDFLVTEIGARCPLVEPGTAGFLGENQGAELGTAAAAQRLSAAPKGGRNHAATAAE